MSTLLLSIYNVCLLAFHLPRGVHQKRQVQRRGYTDQDRSGSPDPAVKDESTRQFAK